MYVNLLFIMHKCHVIHKCTFDYKKENKEQLEKLTKVKQTPVIVI